MDRNELLNTLSQMLPAEFDMVLSLSGVPKRFLSGPSVPMSTRAGEVVSYFENRLGGLESLAEVVAQVRKGVVLPPTHQGGGQSIINNGAVGPQFNDLWHPKIKHRITVAASKVIGSAGVVALFIYVVDRLVTQRGGADWMLAYLLVASLPNFATPYQGTEDGAALFSADAKFTSALSFLLAIANLGAVFLRFATPILIRPSLSTSEQLTQLLLGYTIAELLVAWTWYFSRDYANPSKYHNPKTPEAIVCIEYFNNPHWKRYPAIFALIVINILTVMLDLSLWIAFSAYFIAIIVNEGYLLVWRDKRDSTLKSISTTKQSVPNEP